MMMIIVDDDDDDYDGDDDGGSCDGGPCFGLNMFIKTSFFHHCTMSKSLKWDFCHQMQHYFYK